MRVVGKFWFLLSICCLVGCFATIEQPQGKTYQSTKGWVITGSKAKSLHKQGALFVDVRSSDLYKQLHMKGAVHTTWQHFSESKAPNQGRLLSSDSALTQRLKVLGVSKAKQIVVYGSPAQGWGEEGRIAWMLRVLGHTKTYIVDGGYLALAQAGVPTTKDVKAPPPGDFTVKRNPSWSIQRDALQKKVVMDKSVPKQLALIDTRELREFNGETPYGESRGGHIPGAVHLHFQSILNTLGFLKSRDEILKVLQQKNINPNKPVVVYCTGGIRSGWLAFVMVDLGFTDVKNYAGSMWEWSSGASQQYPLEKTK